jgi:hypothetical protein
MNKRLFFTLVSVLLSLEMFSQISKTGNNSISGAVCPNVNTDYTVTLPTGCGLSWSVTNGTIQSRSGNRATITWNDTPGAKGTVSVTFSSCSASDDNKTVSRSETILSIKNQSFGSYSSSVNLDYCTKATVNLSVPQMFVQGTGGIAQPPRTEVAYAWTLPAGWREVGTGRTGNVGTSLNSISIQPINCSTPGNVTVQGTLIGSGPFCNSAANSATATINLNGANPVVTVGPQVGYTGGSTCDTTPVTFYATPSVALGCISSYGWAFPSSWTEVSRSNNSITLGPSGGMADKNPIRATINFTCGSSVTSANYVPPFNTPAISGPSLICSSSTMTLNYVAPGATVNWIVSATLRIVSGQGTTSISVAPLNSVSDGTGTVRASVTNCPSASVPNKSVWVGKPVFSAYTYDGQPTPFVCEGIYQSFTGGDHVLNAVPGGTSSYPTFQLQTSSPYVRGTPVGYNYNFNVNTKNQNYEFIIRASVANGCGTTTSCTYFTNWASIMESYPNPTDDEFRVQLGKDGETKKVSLINSNIDVVFSVETVENEVVVETATLPEGMYVLKISNGDKTISRHLKVKH